MFELGGIVSRWAVLGRILLELLHQRIEVYCTRFAQVGRRQRRFNGLNPRVEDIVTGDLGAEMLDFDFALLPLFMYIALFPAETKFNRGATRGCTVSYRIRERLSTLGWPSMSESSESWRSKMRGGRTRVDEEYLPRVDPTSGSSEAWWWWSRAY
jgi:hypothetical protein